MAIIAAAIVGAAVVGGAASYAGQQSANRAASDANRDQIGYQEYARNTAYQVAVKDMKAAGLNPILAYQQGGAPVPPGAQPSFGNPGAGFSQLGAQTASAFSTGIQSDLAKDTMAKLKAETINTAEDTSLKRSQQLVNDNMGAKLAQEFNLLKVQTNTAHSIQRREAAMARIAELEQQQLRNYGKGPIADKGQMVERVLRRVIKELQK